MNYEKSTYTIEFFSTASLPDYQLAAEEIRKNLFSPEENKLLMSFRHVETYATHNRDTNEVGFLHSFSVHMMG